MSALNKKIGNILGDLSHIYQFKNGKDRFRAIAYDKAAKVISSLEEDVSSFTRQELDAIPGIGESIADKIAEYIQTGHIKKYETLRKTVPMELLELMNISGFGPQTLRTLHQKLRIRNRRDLVKALEEGRITRLKGFGEKKVSNMLRNLRLHKTVEDRMLLSSASDMGKKLVEALKKIGRMEKIELAGSLRRGKETIGDIDILIACREKDRKKIITEFVALPLVGQVLSKGTTKASVILKENKRQADLRLVSPGEWGAALLYFTGSREHNIHLRTIARERGMKISEYGLFETATGKKIEGETEKGIYRKLGFDWIPPELREEKGELELAATGKLPELVTLADIRGDMQMHSAWSDGSMDIEELGRFLMDHFDYDYAVLTDHSKEVRIAGGMDERTFEKQIRAIADAGKKWKRSLIKAGAEVDILSDGKLDLDDSLLQQLDWVCASIHYGLTHDNTERIIAACESPWVHCIGHPSGRIIGQREPYPVNWDKVFDAARKTGTALEINCQPDRMDLNDELARRAREAGVMLLISTDAHQPSQFSMMNFGVTIARRAGCGPRDILNCRSWKEIGSFTAKKRKQRR